MDSSAILYILYPALDYGVVYRDGRGGYGGRGGDAVGTIRDHYLRGGFSRRGW